MKAKQIKGIMHDLIELRGWRTPLAAPINITPESTSLKINLLTGKISPAKREEDSLSELLKEKREWFKEFLKLHKSKLGDFDKAEMKMIGKKESIKISYKGKNYSREKVW